MQVEFCLAGEITQVIDSIPWVRCASGNVCWHGPGSTDFSGGWDPNFEKFRHIWNVCMKLVSIREGRSSVRKCHLAMDIFGKGRGGWTPFHSFWGVFPNITEPILDDENSTKCQNLPHKSDHFTPNWWVSTDKLPQKWLIMRFFAKCREPLIRRFRKRPPPHSNRVSA